MEKSFKLLEIENTTGTEINIDTNIIIDKPNKQAIFDEVLSEQAGKRQATTSTLTRGEVRGGGIKPRPQKHSGKAQLGSTRASHCVGGGVSFGPKPGKNYKLSVNKKVRNLALKSALTLKYKSSSLFLLANKQQFEKPSTKKIITFINNAKLVKKTLFIINENEKFLIASISNLSNCIVKTLTNFSVRDIINSKAVVIQQDVFNKIDERVSK